MERNLKTVALIYNLQMMALKHLFNQMLLVVTECLYLLSVSPP